MQRHTLQPTSSPPTLLTINLQYISQYSGWFPPEVKSRPANLTQDTQFIWSERDQRWMNVDSNGNEIVVVEEAKVVAPPPPPPTQARPQGAGTTVGSHGALGVASRYALATGVAQF
jgi:hypothetical protein